MPGGGIPGGGAPATQPSGGPGALPFFIGGRPSPLFSAKSTLILDDPNRSPDKRIARSTHEVSANSM